MKLGTLKWTYLALCIFLGGLIVLSSFAQFITLPHGEPFTEIWLLGPNRLIEDYPLNVTSNQLYTVYLGIANHMGDFEYYVAYAQLRNQSDSFPNVTSSAPSGLTPMTEYRVFLSENETWEKQIDFSLGALSYEENMCRISEISIDGATFNVDKTVAFDQQNTGFYVELIFELWRYNTGLSSFEFHDRFVGIWLNVTRAF